MCEEWKHGDGERNECGQVYLDTGDMTKSSADVIGLGFSTNCSSETYFTNG